MGRKQTLIVYPHLNDCGGNMDKDWYVEYKYRIPGNPKQVIERVYKGLQLNSTLERYTKADEIIAEKRNWLNAGKHLTGETKTRLYVDELTYNSVARLYGKLKNEIPTIRQNVSEYLAFIKTQKTYVTYSNIQTKLRVFVAYCELKKLNFEIRDITRKHIIDFMTYLSNDLKLSRSTIKDYKQAVCNYFNYEIDNNRIEVNPVVRMPQLGQIVDNAAVPFTDDEKLLLKNAIKESDPQLWLACQIQYYCAIRPGIELRLMRIKWIDFDKKQIRVPNIEAKNNQTEIVEIPDILYNELINTYKLKDFNSEFYVFGTDKEPGINHYGKNTLRNRFNKFRDKLKISKDKVFYSWKHTGAIDLIENGLLPYNLQDHLRHKNFDTTERYLKKRIKFKESKISKFTKEL